MSTTRKPNHPQQGTTRPVDAHVGKRLRQRRTLLGLSQESLGRAVDLTFQQIQKYERGTNRIGASRLYQLSNILDVPVSYFFDNMPKEVSQTQGDYAKPEAQFTLDSDPMARRETIELVRAYYKIQDPKARKRLFELTKSIANSPA